MHRLTLLEKELLQDRLGKKDGSSGNDRGRPTGHFCILGGLEGWSYGGGLS